MELLRNSKSWIRESIFQTKLGEISEEGTKCFRKMAIEFANLLISWKIFERILMAL